MCQSDMDTPIVSYPMNFNSIGSGVSEPQEAENRYLPLTGGIALTTVYTLTCYTVITIHSFIRLLNQNNEEQHLNTRKNVYLSCLHLTLYSQKISHSVTAQFMTMFAQVFVV